MDNLRKLRHDTISFHNSADGLWDLGLGLCFIMTGLTFLLDIVAYTSIFYFVVFLAVRGVKSKVTYPRIGYADHKGMKASVNKMLVASFIVGALCLLLAVYFAVTLARGNWDEAAKSTMGNVLLAAVTLIVPLLVLLCGLFFKMKRFLWYGSAFFALLIAAWFITWPYTRQTVMIGMGAVMLFVGLVKLVGFIKTYPKLDDGNGDE